jgi:HlyD family secretion protein
MKKVIKITVLVVILGIFLLTIVYLYNKSKQKPVVFKTESPFYTSITRKTVATGSVVPRKEIEIKPVVSGIVEEIYIEAGKNVKKGQNIAKIRIIPDLVNLNNAEGRLDRAKIAYDDAKINYDRLEKLFKEGVVAQAEFQPIQMAFKNAKQEVDAAEANLELIREGVNKKSGKVTNTLITSTIEGMILDIPIKVGSSVIEANHCHGGGCSRHDLPGKGR